MPVLAGRVVFFRRICNVQEKIFFQNCRFSFFRPKMPILFIQK